MTETFSKATAVFSRSVSENSLFYAKSPVWLGGGVM